MIAHSLRTAARGFRKRKTETALMVLTAVLGSVGLGMAVGFVHDARTADTFYNPPAGLYQLNDFAVYGEYETLDSWTMGYLTPWIREHIPAVTEAGRFRGCPAEYVGSRDRLVENMDVTCMESTMFTMLDFPTLSGDPVRTLERPDGAVVTDEAAQRIFGSTDVIGRYVDIPERDTVRTYTVGAVVESIPGNSHIRFDVVRSWLSQNRSAQESNVWQYVLLRRDADPAAIGLRLTEHVTVSIQDRYIREVTLLPFGEVYMKTGLVAQHHGDRAAIVTIVLLGVSLFLIAALNLFGLRMARVAAAHRLIGARLAVGASHGALGWSAAVETMALAPLVVLGIAAASIRLVPLLNSFSESGMSPGLRTMAGAAAAAVVMLAVVAVAVGLWSSSYAARTSISSLFRDASAHGTRRGMTRRIVLVGQLAVFAALLTALGFLRSQFAHIERLDRGHATPEMLYVELERQSIRLQTDRIVERLGQTAAVKSVVRAAGLPGMSGFGQAQYELPRIDDPEQTVTTLFNFIDTTFVSAMDLGIIAGRNVRPGGREPAEVLLNRTAIRRLGFESAYEGIGHEPHRNLRVVGVVEDFAFQSLHEPIRPLILSMSWLPHWFGIGIVAEGASDASLRTRVAAVLEEFGEAPFFRVNTYSDLMAETYEAEARLREAVSWVSAAALMLVIAGLWSISALAAAQREREFGIRKVLGARLIHVFGLHLSEFMRVLPIALLMGALPGYFLVERWMDRFAWRTDALFEPFAVVIVVLTAVTGFAVIISSVPFLTRRPVDSLAAE